jgi:hypothetical protein
MTSIERARDLAGFIDRSLHEFDTISTALVESRLQFEMVKRDPQLGRMSDPQSGRTVILDAADFAQQVTRLADNRQRVVAVLLDISQCGSVDEARELKSHLQMLLTRYEICGECRMLFTEQPLGWHQRVDELATWLLSADEETSPSLDDVDAVFDTLKTQLERVLAAHAFGIAQVEGDNLQSSGLLIR